MMNLDLGPGFDTVSDFGYRDQNMPRIMDTNEQAVLYVFRPYAGQFQDVAFRSYQYNFDENFVQDLQERTDLAQRGNTSDFKVLEDLMVNHNLNDHITAAFQPSLTLQSRHLANVWRFILVFTQKANQLIGANTLAHSPMNSEIRRIYNGFFVEEPFNPATISNNKRTLNPHAMMTITHKSTLSTKIDSGRLGREVSINAQVSEEIIAPNLVTDLVAYNGLGADDWFLMTPENCLNGLEESADGSVLAMPSIHSNVSGDKGNQVVADFLELPNHNVGHAVKGMLRFQTDTTTRNQLGINQPVSRFEDEFLDEATNRQKMANYLGVKRSHYSDPTTDLDVDSQISAAELDRRVNNMLKVVDFAIERPIYYDTLDQSDLNIQNQYSALISYIVVPLLNTAGLNSINFMYQVVRRGGQVHEEFLTRNSEPTWPVPAFTKTKMEKAVEMELVHGVFHTMFNSVGDFHVLVEANVTGFTKVRLNLVGQGGPRNNTDFEMPSCLGGLISPLIGDDVTNVENTNALEKLYAVASGTYSKDGLDDHGQLLRNNSDLNQFLNTARIDNQSQGDSLAGLWT
jgi:hypothetical protein